MFTPPFKLAIHSIKSIGIAVLFYTSNSSAIAQKIMTERGIINTFHYDSPSVKVPIKDMVAFTTTTGKVIHFDANEFQKKSALNLEDLNNTEVDIKYIVNSPVTSYNATQRSTKNTYTVIPTPLEVSVKPSTRSTKAPPKKLGWLKEIIKGQRFIPVLMCKYSDSPEVVTVARNNNIVLTPDLMKAEMVKQTHFWKTNSQNNYELTTQVFGWYTLPFARKDYDPLLGGTRNFDADCMTLADADGFKLDPVYGIMFVSEDPMFSAYVRRDDSFPKKNSRGTYSNIDGSVTNWVRKASRVFITSDAFLSNVIAHELGHAIGIYHSSYNYLGTLYEHNNAWDVVSHQGALNNDHDPQYTLGYNRYKLGWLNNQTQLFTYQLNETTKTVKLETASLLQNTDKRLILLTYPNRPMVYSIELRGVKGGGDNLDPSQQAINFDKLLKSPAIVIHKHTAHPDITIKSVVVNPGKDNTHFNSHSESVMLKEGESWTAPFVDSDKTVFKLTVDTITDTNATVTISTVK